MFKIKQKEESKTRSIFKRQIKILLGYFESNLALSISFNLVPIFCFWLFDLLKCNHEDLVKGKKFKLIKITIENTIFF